MKYLKILFISIISSLVYAQPGNLGQLELSVTDKYKATVGEAVKVNEFPDFKDTTTRKLPVQYSITSQPITFRFNPKPLPPARISKVPVEKLLNGMLRVGYGFYNTPLAEFYYNSGRSSNYNFGFSGKHISTQGGVRDVAYSDNAMSNNELGAYFNRFYNNVKWETEAYAQFDKVSYYGRDTLPHITDGEQPEPPYKWYRQFGLSTKLVESKDKGLGFYNKAGLEYYHLADNAGSMENYFKLLSTVEIPAQKNVIDLDLNVTYFKTAVDSNNFNYDFVEFLDSMDQSYLTIKARPHINTYVKELLFQFGINLYYNVRKASFLNETDNSIYFFPELKVSYPVVKDVLTVYTGINGQLRHNTLKSLVRENPFLQTGPTLKPTRTTDIFIGMTGILSSTTSFNLKGGFMDKNDMALFYRNPFYITDALLTHGLGVIYDDVNIFYAHGEIAMNLKNNFQLGLAGDLRSFDPKEQEAAWHTPSFTAELNAIYTLKKKIKFNSTLFYSGERVAFQKEIVNGNDNVLPAFINANLGIEYLYNSRLSAFINAYNLLNSKYDHYLGYRAQNINILFGIGYQF